MSVFVVEMGGSEGKDFFFCKWIVSNKKAHPYLGK